MPAHLTGELRFGFAHFRLDQRMAGAPHDRAATRLQNPWLQLAGAFDVVDDRRSRIAREHVFGEQHQQTIGIDHLAVRGDHTEAIAVAVEGDSDIGVGLLHR